MAIRGKYETNRITFCPQCKAKHEYVARTLDWTGDLRTDLVCLTPGCNNVFESSKSRLRKTKGHISSRPQVELFTLPDGDMVILEDYDCTEDDAKHFCAVFNRVLARIPRAAREELMRHWQSGKGSPHVWLLENREEWKGGGWGATRSKGRSLCVVSTLVGRIPDEHLEVVIAHELGHMLFIAGNEEHHSSGESDIESLLKPAKRDPLLKFKCEWLVWRLMESWKFDQLAMETWMERNVIDDAAGIQFRDEPINDPESVPDCITKRHEAEERLSDMAFPEPFKKYL